jgi:hypothetical protein
MAGLMKPPQFSTGDLRFLLNHTGKDIAERMEDGRMPVYELGANLAMVMLRTLDEYSGSNKLSEMMRTEFANGLFDGLNSALFPHISNASIVGDPMNVH